MSILTSTVQHGGHERGHRFSSTGTECENGGRPTGTRAVRETSETYSPERKLLLFPGRRIV